MSAASPSPLASASWTALGTTAQVIVTDAAALDAARDAVTRELAAYDLACSRFRPDSELNAVNAAAGTAVEVSRTFAHAVAVALRVARATGGLVDPTLGAELRRAGYDRDFRLLSTAGTGNAGTAAGAGDGRPRPPRDFALTPRRSGAWRHVEADELLGVVRVPEGAELDLGASAKALAADHAARAAHARTGAGVLVSLGGDVAVAGEAPAGGWAIRVRDDHAAAAAGGEADDAGAGQTISIVAGGLATSGTSVRRWRAGGELRHHLLDPRTGRSAATPWRTVSVAAASCVDANAASTAALVRGADALRWLQRGRLPARLVARNGATLHVAGWPTAC